MLLRDHPLMTHHGAHSWPPTWVWAGGLEKAEPQGEVGILREVRLSSIQPADRFFLYIDYEGSIYIGCVLVDNHAFCSQIAAMLQDYCNRRLVDIGSLEVGHLL
jgi:hypothetical protein